MSRKQIIVLLFLLGLIASFNVGEAVEAFLDYLEAEDPISDIALDLLVATISLGAMVYVGFILVRLQRNLSTLRHSMSATRRRLSDSNQRLAKLQSDFSKAIQKQFETWRFSEGEKEVALLMLKGLSFREIGLLRGTLEKTIRQQASSIYSKSGVVGRHEFAAYFLEDLLAPESDAEDAAAP